MELLEHYPFWDLVAHTLKPVTKTPKLRHYGHALSLRCNTKQQFTKSLNLLNKSGVFECDTIKDTFTIYISQKAFSQRKFFKLPKSLAMLEPLLETMGYRWSNHYINPSTPNDCWAVINTSSNHAGQVGMDEYTAIDCVIRMAITRLNSKQKQTEALKTTLTEVLEALK